MPSFVRYNMNGDYTVFTRMKEKGISLAAFATTILFLILTVIMVSVTLQSSYAWLVMGSTLFLFLTLCSYSSCEKTHGSHWRRASIRSDSISTISEGRDNMTGVDYNRSVLPYWITDLPPSYAVAIGRQDGNTLQENRTERTSPYPPPPPYSTIVNVPPRESNTAEEQSQQENRITQVMDTITLVPPHPARMSSNSFQDCGPPERIHSLRIPNSAVRQSQSSYKHSDTLSLDGHLSERGKMNNTVTENGSTC